MVGTLIKINLRALFAGMFRRSRKSKRSKPLMIALIVLFAVYIFGVLGFTIGTMFYNLCGTFFVAGIGWFYFSLAGLLIFALCFITGFFMVQTQLFNARDNELLLSMPIKPSVILSGRLVSLLVFEYIFEAVILLPVIVVLFISGYISAIPVLGFILFVLSAILLPLFALAVGCLFGWIVALITSRMRNKNILTFVLSVLFLLVYFWGYSKMNSYMNSLIKSGTEIAEAVRRAVPPAYHFGLAAAEGNILSFLIFAVSAIVPFAVMYALLSMSFIRITTSNRGAKKVKYREKTLHASGVGMALLKKELRHFFGNPMYILNSSLGAIALIAAAIVMLVRPQLVTGTLAQLSAVLPAVTPGLVGSVALTLLAGMNFISAPTISLEGKNLWLIKSLPVSTRDILLSKTSLHIVAGGVPAVLAGIVCSIRLPADSIMQAVLMVLTPLSITVLVALFGVVLNLIFPRFDWINEIQPIKQGISCMLTMFCGMALVTALALAYVFLLSGVFTPDVFILLCVALFAVLSAALYLYLIKGGVRRFEELD